MRKTSGKTFALGDMVTWVSQANGARRRKVGAIVAVVPAGQFFNDRVLQQYGNIRSSRRPHGRYPLHRRNITTYIVRDNRGRVYAPLAQYLQPLRVSTRAYEPDMPVFVTAPIDFRWRAA